MAHASKQAAKPRKQAAKPCKGKARPATSVPYTAARDCVEKASKQGGKSPSTNKNYCSYMKRITAWAKQKASDEKQREQAWEMNKELMGIDESEDNDCPDDDGDGGTTMSDARALASKGMPENFGEAFDGDPKECTDLAIAMYIAEKAMGDENCGVSTIDGIRAACLDFFNKR